MGVVNEKYSSILVVIIAVLLLSSIGGFSGLGIFGKANRNLRVESANLRNTIVESQSEIKQGDKIKESLNARIDEFEKEKLADKERNLRLEEHNRRLTSLLISSGRDIDGVENGLDSIGRELQEAIDAIDRAIGNSGEVRVRKTEDDNWIYPWDYWGMHCIGSYRVLNRKI